MRKKLILALLLMTLLVFSTLPRIYASTNLSFTLVSPPFTFENYNGDYVLIKLPGFINIGMQDEYLLPRKNIKILIPNGAKFVSYRISEIKKTELSGIYRIPTGENPISEDGRIYKLNEKIKDISTPLELTEIENERG